MYEDQGVCTEAYRIEGQQFIYRKGKEKILKLSKEKITIFPSQKMQNGYSVHRKRKRWLWKH